MTPQVIEPNSRSVAPQSYSGFPGNGGLPDRTPAPQSYGGFPGGNYGGFPPRVGAPQSYGGFPGGGYGGFPGGSYGGFPASTATYSGFPGYPSTQDKDRSNLVGIKSPGFEGSPTSSDVPGQTSTQVSEDRPNPSIILVSPPAPTLPGFVPPIVHDQTGGVSSGGDVIRTMPEPFTIINPADGTLEVVPEVVADYFPPHSSEPFNPPIVTDQPLTGSGTPTLVVDNFTPQTYGPLNLPIVDSVGSLDQILNTRTDAPQAGGGVVVPSTTNVQPTVPGFVPPPAPTLPGFVPPPATDMPTMTNDVPKNPSVPPVVPVYGVAPTITQLTPVMPPIVTNQPPTGSVTPIMAVDQWGDISGPGVPINSPNGTIIPESLNNGYVTKPPTTDTAGSGANASTDWYRGVPIYSPDGTVIPNYSTDIPQPHPDPTIDLGGGDVISILPEPNSPPPPVNGAPAAPGSSQTGDDILRAPSYTPRVGEIPVYRDALPDETYVLPNSNGSVSFINAKTGETKHEWPIHIKDKDGLPVYKPTMPLQTAGPNGIIAYPDPSVVNPDGTHVGGEKFTFSPEPDLAADRLLPSVPPIVPTPPAKQETSQSVDILTSDIKNKPTTLQSIVAEASRAAAVQLNSEGVSLTTDLQANVPVAIVPGTKVKSSDLLQSASGAVSSMPKDVPIYSNDILGASPQGQVFKEGVHIMKVEGPLMCMPGDPKAVSGMYGGSGGYSSQPAQGTSPTDVVVSPPQPPLDHGVGSVPGFSS